MASLASLYREYFQMSFSVSSSNVHFQHCLQEHIDVYEAIAERRPADAGGNASPAEPHPRGRPPSDGEVHDHLPALAGRDTHRIPADCCGNLCRTASTHPCTTHPSQTQRHSLLRFIRSSFQDVGLYQQLEEI